MQNVGQNSGGSGRLQIRFENAPTLDLSIIIVSWNAKNHLLKCLKSLAQTSGVATMEIIVVDNASTDGSPELVEGSFPHVRLIRNSANLGFAKANNIGMRVSKGRYFGLINSDVEVLDNCLVRLIKHMDQNPRLGMTGPSVFGGDGKIQRSCRGFPGVWNMFCRCLALDHLFPSCQCFNGYQLLNWNQDTERLVDILSGCFWLVRREAVEQVGGLDEGFFMYGEDMDWCRRFRNAGREVMFVPSARAIHYGGASSSNAPVRFYIEKQRADLQYWKKHHSRVATVCFLLISGLHLLLRAGGYSLALLLHKGARHVYQFKVKRSLACLKWLFSESFAAL